MESLALLPVTIASIFGSFSGGDVPVEEAVIRTHTSPEIAGLWELDLDSDPSNLNADSSTSTTVSRANEIDIDNVNDSVKQNKVGTDKSLAVPDGDALVNITDEQSSLLGSDSVVNILEQSRIKQVANEDLTLSNEQEEKLKALNDVPESAITSKTCRERYNFGADNELFTTSGDEWTYGNYVYQHQENGLPMLVVATIYDNNEVDCSGQRIDQAGEVAVVFVDYQPDKNTMKWCADDKGVNCVMSFRRLLP